MYCKLVERWLFVWDRLAKPSGFLLHGKLTILPRSASWESLSLLESEFSEMTGQAFTNRFSSVPIPSIVTETVFWSSFMDPAPTDVPQQIISPGNKVISRDRMLTILRGGMIISATG